MFSLPPSVEYIINTIEGAGHTAWCVGGCVRDMLMGKTPNDYDIASSAPCEIIQNLFEKTIPTGIKHGTVTVIIDGVPYEVTRYRIDGEYNDNRHPDNVKFTEDFAFDLSRRDFTVNAMGYNKKYGVCDLYGGKDDIDNKIIRAVGDPTKRFSEDALRIIRAIRFASVLDFSIENETLKAVKEQANLLSNIASERVTTELLKTLLGEKPSVLKELISAGGLIVYGIESTADLSLLDRLPNIDALRLAALCKICESDIENVLSGLRLSNKQKNEVLGYYSILSLNELTLKNLKPFASKVGYSNLDRAVVAYGAIKGINVNEISKAIKISAQKNEPYCIDMLNITGNEIKELGFEGSEIGVVQLKLLDMVLEHPQSNTKELLINKAKNL